MTAAAPPRRPWRGASADEMKPWGAGNRLGFHTISLPPAAAPRTTAQVSPTMVAAEPGGERRRGIARAKPTPSAASLTPCGPRYSIGALLKTNPSRRAHAKGYLSRSDDLGHLRGDRRRGVRDARSGVGGG